MVVAPIDYDPLVRNRVGYPAFEIAVSHIEKTAAVQGAVRGHLVADENLEDLAADLFI